MDRIAPAPRSARQQPAGPVALASRPSRNTGARVKGVYDIPAGQHVYVGNNVYQTPWWVGSLDTRFVTWGAEWEGTGTSPSDVYAPHMRGVTLWGFDAESNPYPIVQAGMAARVAPAGETTYGSVLGADRSAVCELLFTGHVPDLTIRYLGYGPFPQPYILSPPTFAIRAFDVVGDSIVSGPEYAFTFLTMTAPPGPVVLGYMGLGPDFVWNLHLPEIIGLSKTRALMVAGASKNSEGPLDTSTWLCVWVFDPFDPEGTLKDIANPTVGRQPDAMIQLSSLGGMSAVYSLHGARRTDDEAVMVLVTYDGVDVSAGSELRVLRLNAAGALTGNSVAGDFASQSYTLPVFPHDMGQGVVHSGDLRIDAGHSALGSSVPNHTVGGTTLRTATRRYDANRYMYVRENYAASPAELVFTVRDTLTDAAIGSVTSYADLDVEVAAINQLLTGEGNAGVVGENLLATWRYSPYVERNQVITVEIGGLRSVGTAQVLGENNRFNRLPQGRI